MKHYKEQKLLSSWADSSCPTQGSMGYIIKDAGLIKGEGNNQYIAFDCRFTDRWRKVIFNGTLPDVSTTIYICVRGNHAVEGRRILQQLESRIGAGKLDNTKLYIGSEFCCRFEKTTINNYNFNTITKIYGAQ
jgi:hypothetical protein